MWFLNFEAVVFPEPLLYPWEGSSQSEMVIYDMIMSQEIVQSVFKMLLEF